MGRSYYCLCNDNIEVVPENFDYVRRVEDAWERSVHCSKFCGSNKNEQYSHGSK